MAFELPPDDKEMSLGEHLRELRNRLVIVIGVTLALMAIVFPFSGGLVDAVIAHVVPSYVKITAYAPLELFKTRITVCFIVAVCVGFPLLVYEAFRFAAPGLYPAERRFLKVVFPFSLALFIAGASVAYLVTLPLFFGIVIGNGASVAAPNLSLGETFGIVTNFMLGFGVVFQVPLVIMLAVRMKLVRRETLAKGRLGVYGLLFAFAMFISPDPTFFSQLIVLAILAALFEVGLFLSKFI
ncbi:MAG: twin-arginine translocase subunit TatC [Methanocella sp.]